MSSAGREPRVSGRVARVSRPPGSRHRQPMAGRARPEQGTVACITPPLPGLSSGARLFAYSPSSLPGAISAPFAFATTDADDRGDHGPRCRPRGGGRAPRAATGAPPAPDEPAPCPDLHLPAPDGVHGPHREALGRAAART